MISLNSNQIVYNVDPLTTAYPFGRDVQQFCFNASEWYVQQRAFHDVAMQFGYLCLIVGAIIGALAGYYYAKRKYGCSK
jgi:hypothetical protein